MAWLRYDPSRADRVEEAYDAFIRAAPPGAGALRSIIVSVIVALGVYAVTQPWLHARAMLVAIEFSAMSCYAAYIAWIWLRCPRDVLDTVLQGCVDMRRACIYASLASLLIAVVVVVLVHWLQSFSHVPRTLHRSAFLLVTGALYGVVLAPPAEEAFFQGWMQTRLQRFGWLFAPLATTAIFLAYHLPKHPADFVRVLGLGFNAYLRSTTRSLAACIAAHASYNLVVTIVGLVFELTNQGVGHP
jgi:membrane protease YdiL (CAAX protease family)